MLIKMFCRKSSIGSAERAEMQKLVIATRNPDKLREIRAILQALPIKIVSSAELLPDFDVVEDQDTILGNALKKALETAQATGSYCLADDTGLYIQALDGEPGVFAARYAGKGCSYADNRHKVLKRMQHVSDRAAEFRTVMAVAEPEGIIGYREGIVKGFITLIAVSYTHLTLPTILRV